MRKRTLPLLSLLGLCGVLLGCGHPSATAPIVDNSNSGASRPRGSQVASTPADQQDAPILPDPRMTPGATLPVTKDDICVPGYAHKVRNVPVSVKRQAYAEYGITSHRPGDYEVDHLISLELGGSNSLKNLWPESFKTQPWNAHVKDALENKMHDLVCSGQLDLPTAQHEIATDWIAAYKKYFHTNRPLASGMRGEDREGETDLPANDTAPAPAADTSNAGQVWVNTRSGKYFLPGAKYYGKTKEGQYMTEAQAKAQGFIAAQGQ